MFRSSKVRKRPRLIFSLFETRKMSRKKSNCTIDIDRFIWNVRIQVRVLTAVGGCAVDLDLERQIWYPFHARGAGRSHRAAVPPLRSPRGVALLRHTSSASHPPRQATLSGPLTASLCSSCHPNPSINSRIPRWPPPHARCHIFLYIIRANYPYHPTSQRSSPFLSSPFLSYFWLNYGNQTELTSSRATFLGFN